MDSNRDLHESSQNHTRSSAKWVARNRLEEAYGAFAAVCARLSDDQSEHGGVCGAWSPRQVAAHLAGWDEEATCRFGALQIDPTTSVTYDVDACNSRWVAARAQLTWAETLAELAAANRLLLAAVDDVPEGLYASVSDFGDWLAGRAGDYALHTNQIQVWLREAEACNG